MLRWLYVAVLLVSGCATPFSEAVRLRERDKASAQSSGADRVEPSATESDVARDGLTGKQPAAPKQFVARTAVTDAPAAAAKPATAAAHAPDAVGGSMAAPNSPARTQPPEFEDATLKAVAQLPPHFRNLLREQMLAVHGGVATPPENAGPPTSSPERYSSKVTTVTDAPAAPLLPGPEQAASRGNQVKLAGWPQPLRDATGDATYPSTKTNSDSAPAQSKVTPSGESPPTGGPAVGDGKDGSETPLGLPPAEGQPVAPDAWRDKLTQTLELIEKEIARRPQDGEESATLAAAARLLHVVANHPEKAVAGIEQLSEDEREFWKHQAHALLLALNADQKNVASRRAALAQRELRAASDHLSNMSLLDVRNLALCEEVESYGRFTEFRANSFRPGAEVLLYVEVDNFAVTPVGDKFETELRGSYEIVDTKGNRVARVELPPDKKLCNNRRRDFFFAYAIFLPKEILPGSYTLHLTIEDVKGHKSSQASLDLRFGISA